MCGHTGDLVIYSKFHRNPFRSFGAPGGQNLAFPITLVIGFYSLYYSTSSDAFTFNANRNRVIFLSKPWQNVILRGLNVPCRAVCLFADACDCRTSSKTMTSNWTGFSKHHWHTTLSMWAFVICCCRLRCHTVTTTVYYSTNQEHTCVMHIVISSLVSTPSTLSYEVIYCPRRRQERGYGV